MAILKKIRHHLGSNPTLNHIYRSLTGKNGPKWHLIIEFNASSKTWKCTSYPCYQSRNPSTYHLAMEAMERHRTQFKNSFRAVAWLGDQPPPWWFKGKHLAYCRNSSQTDTTLIPDHVMWAWPEAGIADYSHMVAEMIAASQTPFSKRGVFWIGSIKQHPTRQLLFDYAKLDHRIIARTVEWIGDTANTNGEKLTTKKNNFVSLPDHCDYQYLIDLQGGGYSGRVKLLMFSGRPLFLQARQWEEYYFEKMHPFEHYIPVLEDLSDLSKQLDWADNHPVEAAQIAENAMQFAKKHLTKEAAIEEYAKVFLRLSNG